jgi:diadenosine tetraphosphatase ApaH/serine/threonine PP2A family protein phosphatase
MNTDRTLNTESLSRDRETTPRQNWQHRSTGGIAIVSDIHANIDALGAVLKDIADRRCFSIFCLGDTIGYGPEPAACVQYMREYAPINLMGNHEAMYLATRPKGKKRLKPDELGDLWPPLELCHRQLGADDAEWIAQLPLVVPISEMELVHGSLHEPPTFDYIINSSLAKQHFAKQTTRVSFYGHTHIPAIWEEKNRKMTCYTPAEKAVTLHPESRYAIGVGSVGQPRDDDPRTCYVIYQPGSNSIEFRRIAYDITKAQARFKKARLPKFDTERIADGK